MEGASRRCFQHPYWEGADTRFIQEMLGHANLQTTQIYTHVAIKKLKEIHTATHPGATLESPKARDDDAGDDVAEP